MRGTASHHTPNGSPRLDSIREPLTEPLRRFAIMVAQASEARINPTTANLARVDEWLDRLAGEVNTAAQSEELTRYLRTLARFWRYSPRNCWLIGVQMPTATRDRKSVV